MTQKGDAKGAGLSLEDLERAISADVPGALPGPALVSHLVESSTAHHNRKPHTVGQIHDRCVTHNAYIQTIWLQYVLI